MLLNRGIVLTLHLAMNAQVGAIVKNPRMGNALILDNSGARNSYSLSGLPAGYFNFLQS
jgi:transporter family-2 protein